MMEQRYRHMMDQVNMDKDFEAGLLERIQEGRPRRRPRPLRTALIAACVCVAVVGTAVAARTLLGVEVAELSTHSYRLEIGGLKRWTQNSEPYPAARPGP